MLNIEQFSNKLKQIFTLKELRGKIIFTLLMLLVARIGTQIPVPGVNWQSLQQMVQGNSLLAMFNLFSGGGLARATIFALGVMPYIDASIIMQLLGVVVPKIEEMQKEGDAGRQKIIQYTRYLTIVIGFIQAAGVSIWIYSMHMVLPGENIFFFMVTSIVILTAGTVFLMFIGEQITVNGIGNGISIIIAVNIIARVPSMVYQMVTQLQQQAFSLMVVKLTIILVFFIVLIIAICYVQLSERRIPVQYAGKGFSSNARLASKTYIPLKIIMAGVIPIIFAYVILMIPGLIVKIIPSHFISLQTFLSTIFSPTNPVYLTLEFVIVVFFSYFYTAIVFDPEKVAENLKQSGGAIPGIRPGQETVEYLERVAIRITTVGALFLGTVSVLPSILSLVLGVQIYITGISLLIMVGVALDFVQQINANLVMRNYDGFIR